MVKAVLELVNYLDMVAVQTVMLLQLDQIIQGVHIPVMQVYMDVVQTTTQQQEAPTERGVRIAVSCPDLGVVLIAIFQPLDPITQVVHTHVKPVCMDVVLTIIQLQLVQMEKVV